MGAAQLHVVRRGRLPDLATRSRGRARRLVARLHLRGHRVHVSRPPGAAGPRCQLPHRLPARLRGRDRGAGYGAEARLPEGAVAAGDFRDVLAQPKNVVQPEVRESRPARHAVLPSLGDRRSRLRGARARHPRCRRRHRSRGLAGVRAVHAGDHARQQRAHDRSPPHARSQREDVPAVEDGLAARPDAARDARLPADPRVGPGEGNLEIRSGGQVLAPVRAQHTGGAA